jgi:hypothetical protein
MNRLLAALPPDWHSAAARRSSIFFTNIIIESSRVPTPISRDNRDMDSGPPFQQAFPFTGQPCRLPARLGHLLPFDEQNSRPPHSH